MGRTCQPSRAAGRCRPPAPRVLAKSAAGSAGATITIDSPALTVTGTDDLVLAAILASPEVVPQVRMLAACERVLAKGS